jgi:phage-related minor tail protein
MDDDCECCCAATTSAAARSASSADDDLRKLEKRQHDLVLNSNKFAAAMTGAFTQAISGGKQLDEVLKGLALRLSDMVLKSALQPVMQSVAGSLTSGLEKTFAGLFGGVGVKAAQGAVKPFATGGVIGTPTYFPLLSGGVGLAGEAGPEAILPLSRGADGRLGVAASGGGSAGSAVTVQIVTPDLDSFRRSEVYLAGQIARAVARGQRDL